jgi:hypothetical protein
MRVRSWGLLRKWDGIGKPVITREVDDREGVAFGISGLLINGNVVRAATASALGEFEQQICRFIKQMVYGCPAKYVALPTWGILGQEVDFSHRWSCGWGPRGPLGTHSF